MRCLMNFNNHSDYEGKHAFLGASTYSWIRYDLDKLTSRYRNEAAKERGTRLHALACEHIKLHIPMPDDGSTLSLYINDAIRYKLTPEQVLFYSPNCFGTADSIGYFPFEYGKPRLIIHDLKTGITKCSMDQLKIYAAIFCLEYNCNPEDMDIYLRIYKDGSCIELEPPPDDIREIMDIIPIFDQRIEQIRQEAGL